jgi:uncharacterized lipoprotein YehR (DUF1307 family)
MKRIRNVVLALTIMLSVFSMTGCNSGNGEVGQTTVQRTFKGELNFLTSSFGDLDVTHVLVTEAKERVYLRSLLYDLDGFVNMEVRVSGPFNEEEVSSRVVNVLTVETVDVLSEEEEEEVEVDEQTFEGEEIGLSFIYNGNLLSRTLSSETVVFEGESGSDVITVRLFEVTEDFNAEAYITQNYSSEDFETTTLANGSVALTNSPGVNGALIYLVKRDGYFYKFTLVNSDDDTLELYAAELQSILDSLTWSEIEVVETNDEEDASTEEAGEETTDEEAQTISETKNLDSVSLTTQNRINSFEDSVIGLGLSSSFDSAVSYAFTDNGYFYVVYNSGEDQRRALVSYDEANNFNVVAQFVPGSVATWDLVSGDNVAYDRPLTMVLVDGESGARELTLEQGYRYFESIPLGFGLQYPQNWYYSRVEDAYHFSDKPIGEGELLVIAVESETSFDSVSGTTIEPGVKKSGSKYYVKLDEEVTYELSGDATYDVEMQTMARSFVRIEEE